MSRCKHPKWSVVARRFTPGVQSISGFKSRGMNVRDLDNMLFGFTVIEQQCEECEKTEFAKVNGDQRNG